MFFYYSAVPPALRKTILQNTHDLCLSPLRHVTCAIRTDLLKSIDLWFSHSICLLQSVPFLSSAKQRSQSVTPYSCQVPWTRVSFIAFILFHMITYHFFNYKPHFYEIYLLLRCKNLMHNAFLINIAIKNSTGAIGFPVVFLVIFQKSVILWKKEILILAASVRPAW